MHEQITSWLHFSVTFWLGILWFIEVLRSLEIFFKELVLFVSYFDKNPEIGVMCSEYNTVLVVLIYFLSP